MDIWFLKLIAKGAIYGSKKVTQYSNMLYPIICDLYKIYYYAYILMVALLAQFSFYLQAQSNQNVTVKDKWRLSCGFKCPHHLRIL